INDRKEGLIVVETGAVGREVGHSAGRYAPRTSDVQRHWPAIASKELRRERDRRRRERLRQRAPFLRPLGEHMELLRRDPGNARIDLERDRLDRESVF